MAVAKKKKVSKIAPKKKAVKKTTKSLPKTRKKREKREMSSEVIFDSRVGKTDALFVDEPKPINPAPVQEQLNPIIDDVLKEIDESEKSSVGTMPQENPMGMEKPVLQPEIEPQLQAQKKSWWQRLFKR